MTETVTTTEVNMLTRIVETSKGYKVGDSFTLDGKSYTITETLVDGDLTLLYLN